MSGSINSKRKGKLIKKAQKGEINTLEMFFECISSNIYGKGALQVKLDTSRLNGYHNLNLSEVRDLIMAITGSIPMPKYFEVRNRPFVRNIIICHVNNATNMDDILSDIGLGKTYKVRVSTRHNLEVAALPRRLLSLSAEDFHALQTNRKPEVSTISSSDTKKYSVLPDWSTIQAYILSPAVMRTWGYPMISMSHDDNNNNAVTSPATEGATSDDEIPSKRAKLCPESTTGDALPAALVGVTTGLQYVSVKIIPRKSLSASVGGMALTNFCETMSRTSDQYLELFQHIFSDGPNNATIPSPMKPNSSNAIPEFDVVAVDCEMCESEFGHELTRLTLIDKYSRVLLDTLVLPSNEIIDYKTQWSGITQEMLAPVTVSFEQARDAFLRIVSAETILVGHSLDSDLKALKVCHYKCVDTAMMFPHPKGFPLRRKLRTLAENYLHMKIQKTSSKSCTSGIGAQGHDSVEDARAAMRLANLKVEKGHMYGVKGSVPLEDEFRQPLNAFIDVVREDESSNSMVSGCDGSLFLFCNVEEENAMRCCVGSDSVGLTCSSMDQAIAGMCRYFSDSNENGTKVRQSCQEIAELLRSQQSPETETGTGMLAVDIPEPVKEISVPQDEINTVTHDDSDVTGEEINEEEGETAELPVSYMNEQQASLHEAFNRRVFDNMNSSHGAGGVRIGYVSIDALHCGDKAAAELVSRCLHELRHTLESNRNKRSMASTPPPLLRDVERDTSTSLPDDPQTSTTEIASNMVVNGDTLVILSCQSCNQQAANLLKKRTACQDIRSASVWTTELEEKLKHALNATNIASMSLKII